MEKCSEKNILKNQTEGSSECVLGDYHELILPKCITEDEGSTVNRSSPPIPPRKSLKTTLSPKSRTLKKPRALPPPASSAIVTDSILNNRDHNNQTAAPPPLPVKSYNKKSTSRNVELVDKAVQCSPKEEFMQDGIVSHLISTDNKTQVVQTDSVLVLSTNAKIIFTPSNPIQTIVLAPQTNDLNAGITTSTTRTIVVQSTPMPHTSIITVEETGITEDPGNEQSNEIGRLALESLTPPRLQSRGCANEYVGDPVSCKKSLKKNTFSKKNDLSSTLGEESNRKRSLVCQKCLKCKCNQCRNNNNNNSNNNNNYNNYGSTRGESLRKLSRIESKTFEEKKKVDSAQETGKELLVSLGDDGKLVTRSIIERNDGERIGGGGGGVVPCRRGLMFLLQCFSSICCCNCKSRHNCWIRSPDGCRCEGNGEDLNGIEDGDDEVFLACNT